MIAHLTGKLLYKSPEFSLVDVNGVGYQVFIPLSTFYELPECESPVGLHTYTHVREDALQLYGFKTVAEKAMFISLISISGIGPKLALNVLSGIDVAELEEAILKGDVHRICRVPGVGKKTAERIVVELRDKIGKKAPELAVETVARKDEGKKSYDDAVSALVNLGYKKPAAEEALRGVSGDAVEAISLEQLLRRALQTLARL